jgi:hypothetical protein
MTALRANIIEIFTYIRFAGDHLDNALRCLELNHKMLDALLNAGVKASSPANISSIGNSMEDLNLMEAILHTLLHFSSSLNKNCVLNQNEFLQVGNQLLSIMQDLLDHRIRIRHGLLLNTLVKPHPRIVPFTLLYMSRKPFDEYQRILDGFGRLRASSPRQVDKGLVNSVFRRVPSLMHLSRLVVSVRCFKGKQCPNDVNQLEIPKPLKDYLLFMTDMQSADRLLLKAS